MPVEMFGILIRSEIGQDAAGPMLGDHLLRHLANHLQQFQEQWRIAFFERKQRGDVSLGNDDDVDRPEGMSVMISENILGLSHAVSRSTSA